MNASASTLICVHTKWVGFSFWLVCTFLSLKHFPTVQQTFKQKFEKNKIKNVSLKRCMTRAAEVQ